MSVLVATLSLAFVMSILALGVHISFRVFRTADITADGSFPLGAAVAAVLIDQGTNPLLATLVATVAGCAAGGIAGIIHTRMKVNAILAGIIVMTALYSVNLHVMGKSNIAITGAETIFTPARAAIESWLPGSTHWEIPGGSISLDELAALATSSLGLLLIACVLCWFLRTEVGSAMRAAGDNPRAMRALGANTDSLYVFGVSLSNGLVALSGALFAQLQGFADAQMGIGVIVLGLASVIIGQSLVGTRGVLIPIIGTIVGTLLFRLLVSLAVRAGLNPNDLKLVTALVVLTTLAMPQFLDSFRHRRRVVNAAP